jgi:hypothetical protein
MTGSFAGTCRIKGAGQEDSPKRAVILLTTAIDLLDRVPPRYRALVLLAACLPVTESPPETPSLTLRSGTQRARPEPG